MHEKLSSVDPETAARLKPNDSQRVQRALEVFEITGKPMSVLLADSPSEDGREGSSIPAWINLVSLEPSDRARLEVLGSRRSSGAPKRCSTNYRYLRQQRLFL